MTHANRLKPLTEALADHSSEGIAILTAEPARALQRRRPGDDRPGAVRAGLVVLRHAPM